MTFRVPLFLLFAWWLLASTPQLAAGSSADPSTAKAALSAADQAYNRAAKERDRESFHALLSSDALFFADTLKRGRIDYVASWAPLFEGKYDFRYLGDLQEVIVAESGDMGWTRGNATTSFVRPGSQEAVETPSQYMTVWRKGPEGQWQVVASATLVVHPEHGAARDPRSGLMTAWPELADQIDARIKIEWTPESTVRAQSGELAYSLGSYFAEFEKGGTTRAGGGAYLAVWEQDENGTWQLSAEGFTPPQIHSP